MYIKYKSMLATVGNFSIKLSFYTTDNNTTNRNLRNDKAHHDLEPNRQVLCDRLQA